MTKACRSSFRLADPPASHNFSPDRDPVRRPFDSEWKMGKRYPGSRIPKSQTCDVSLGPWTEGQELKPLNSQVRQTQDFGRSMFTIRSGSVRTLFGSLGSIRSSFRFVTLTGFNFIIVRCNPGGGRRHECAERIESGKLCGPQRRFRCSCQGHFVHVDPPGCSSCAYNRHATSVQLIFPANCYAGTVKVRSRQMVVTRTSSMMACEVFASYLDIPTGQAARFAGSRSYACFISQRGNGILLQSTEFSVAEARVV